MKFILPDIVPWGGAIYGRDERARRFGRYPYREIYLASACCAAKLGGDMNVAVRIAENR